ncbi:MAG TPA: helix-turn-helix transcriptional regulator [Myxococcaceae bacterium]|jgi:transcriptional regulator with XRE-family HTH domain|nr:helix-turn-helix transcriptional regulator [Myxococcaceae bacterium]
MVRSIRERFGAQIRKLRLARRLTQDQLAELCDLSADAIRRIERGAFSPSLDTIRKLCSGLGISIRTLFEELERKRRDEVAELCDYLEKRNAREVKLAWRVVRAMFSES